MGALLGAGLLVLLALFTLRLALGQPAPPTTLSEAIIQRGYTASAATAPAYAGNVTQLDIVSQTITQGWQGYYGQVSGTIVLDDSQNNSIYAWDIASPEGEIYATRSAASITWTAGNVVCANITHVGTEETALNFNLDGGQDADGINETFSYSTHQGFNVSAKGFEPGECNFTVSTYVNDTAPGGNYPRAFNETLLYSRSESAMVYAALLNNDQYGFNESLWDFQMLVAEDGHQSDTTSTTYYFYVELS